MPRLATGAALARSGNDHVRDQAEQAGALVLGLTGLGGGDQQDRAAQDMRQS